MINRWLLALALLLAVLSWPPQWYPLSVRLKLTEVFGAAEFRPLPGSITNPDTTAEKFCPPDPEGWREKQLIEGLEIRNSAPCIPDNPFAVAAFVRGTNNIEQATLLKSGLTADAVEKGRDLDGDGDPDEIHIRLGGGRTQWRVRIKPGSCDPLFNRTGHRAWIVGFCAEISRNGG